MEQKADHQKCGYHEYLTTVDQVYHGSENKSWSHKVDMENIISIMYGELLYFQ